MNIKTLKRNIKLLTETSINYKNDNGDGFITILPKAFFDNNGTLELQIFSEILKLTHALKRFSVIDVSQIMMLESKHSIRMLMLLERIYNFADNISKRQKYELEDLNLLFGTQYKKIAEIERAILIPAKKELDATSKISFEYQTNYDKIHRTAGRAKAVSVTIDLIQRKFTQGTL
jgi:plasmid replication initiation protein